MSVEVISFIPERTNLRLYAGDPATLQLTITNAITGMLTGDGEYIAQIRHSRSDDEVLMVFTVDESEIASGTLLLGLSSEQTEALLGEANSFGGEWDCQWFPTSGEPVTLIQGQVACYRDVTRIETP